MTVTGLDCDRFTELTLSVNPDVTGTLEHCKVAGHKSDMLMKNVFLKLYNMWLHPPPNPPCPKRH